MVGTRHAAFWDKVVGGGVTLISTTECGVSKVTQEQAEEVSMLLGATTEFSPPPYTISWVLPRECMTPLKLSCLT